MFGELTKDYLLKLLQISKDNGYFKIRPIKPKRPKVTSVLPNLEELLYVVVMWNVREISVIPIKKLKIIYKSGYV